MWMARAKSLMRRLRRKAKAKDIEGMLGLLEHDCTAAVLDLGCGSGEKTVRAAERIGTIDVVGVDGVQANCAEAEARGLRIVEANLEEPLPLDAMAFDVVLASHVIEHLRYTEQFLSEIHRVLRPGGYAVIATDNLAAWHNIFALVLGWQPFPLTAISTKAIAVGNPLSLATEATRGRYVSFEEYQHIRVFTATALVEQLANEGFTVERVVGSGYAPLPWWLGRLDVRHSTFLSIKARKPS